MCFGSVRNHSLLIICNRFSYCLVVLLEQCQFPVTIVTDACKLLRQAETGRHGPKCKMRIDDILSLQAGRIVALGADGRLYHSNPVEGDPFALLKSATLNPELHRWTPWNIGDDCDVDEIAARFREEAQKQHSFPVRKGSYHEAYDDAEDES